MLEFDKKENEKINKLLNHIKDLKVEKHRNEETSYIINMFNLMYKRIQKIPKSKFEKRNFFILVWSIYLYNWYQDYMYPIIQFFD